MDTEKDLQEKSKPESEVGPIVGSLIIVVILVIAAVYYWGQHLNTIQEQNTAAQKSALELQQEAESEGAVIISTSTNISDIEKDLNAINSFGSTSSKIATSTTSTKSAQKIK
jgi:uncharacterized protein HemX